MGVALRLIHSHTVAGSAPVARAASCSDSGSRTGRSSVAGAPHRTVRCALRGKIPSHRCLFGGARPPCCGVCDQCVPNREPAVQDDHNQKTQHLLVLSINQSGRPDLNRGPHRPETHGPGPPRYVFPANTLLRVMDAVIAKARIVRAIPADWAHKSPVCPIGLGTDHWSQWMKLSYGGPSEVNSSSDFTSGPTDPAP
jgi:hypothetical protein